MGHKNKNYQKTLHQQVYDKLTSMQAFGESKTTAKNDGTTSNKIFSFSTYASYYRCCQDFIKYIKITHPDVTTLTKAQKYVNEYLQKKVDANLSAWTVSLYTSALCKLYQISATDKNRFHPPTRHRSDIQRSRGHTRSDRHFSEKNHSELVDFCRGTGFRRNVLEKLESKNLWTQDDLIHKKLCLEKKSELSSTDQRTLSIITDALHTFPNYKFFLYHEKDKGGKYRFSPIIGEHTKAIVRRIRNTLPGQKVFLYVPKAADIHSYRADYATALYRELYAKSCSINELSYKDRYYCRGDEKGKVLSKPVMQKVSKALGHNRISVIAASYLNNI